MGLKHVVYFGLVASIFGGFLPIRTKKKGPTIFHLYLFISFLVFPLIVAYAPQVGWIGWLAYSLITLVSFLVLKIVNFRLHLSLGTVRPPKPPEPPQEDQESVLDVEDPKQEPPDEAVVVKEKEDRLSVPSHTDSAELNKSANHPVPAISVSYELASRSMDPLQTGPRDMLTVVDVEETAEAEPGHKSPMGRAKSVEDTLKAIASDDPSAVGLMSPVHHSIANIDTAKHTSVVAMLNEASTQDVRERHSISEGTSPVLRRDRTAAGICIQRGRSFQQELEEGDDSDSFLHRHNAVRSRQARRYSLPATTGVSVPSAAPPTLSPLPASPLTPSLASQPSSLVEQVRNKLYIIERYALTEVVEKMSSALLEAILIDVVPESCYENLTSRVDELKRGHLASEGGDSSSGAIHWFEVSNGEWNFYVFESEIPNELQSDSSHTSDDFLSDDQLSRYLRWGLESSITRAPTPPRRPEPVVRPAQDKTPTYEVIPFVKKTVLKLKFARKTLEEYMDRNVSWKETFGTVFLATMVCVVTALLFNFTDFYPSNGALPFFLCFTVATAHFSLIKSVEDDPASPTPGQNNITALSRAVYYIVIGLIALCIHFALEYATFTPLIVYGFDVNSRAVLMFVRDGLLIILLFFPVIFMLGWLPQPDTFAIYFSEQLDIHIFGGTPCTGLLCSGYSLGRSLLVVALLWPLGWAAFNTLKVDTLINSTSPEYSPDFPGASCVVEDRVAMAFFIGLVFALSFILSRSTSNHQYLWDLLLRGFRKCRSCVSNSNNGSVANSPPDFTDPLGDIYCQTLCSRMVYDMLTGLFVFVFITGLNLTTLFCLSPIPAYVVYGITFCLGVLNHYILPHLRKEMPWLLCSEPLVKSKDYDAFEVTEDSRLSVVEYLLQWLIFIEKSIFYPLTFLFALNLSAHHYKLEFGEFGAALVVTVVAMKLLRSTWTELSRQYFILTFSLFFFNFDYAHLNEGFPLNYFIIAILFNKFYDLVLKMRFIYIYIAPWQTSWSSAGHIIAQPLLIPHTPLIFLQTLISSILGAPMNPVYASTFFLLSYVRPVKYWEKDYNTKRADSSNTRLDLQLEGSLRNPNPDRLDSLFYEHLTWVLQKSLCGDLALGRWGNVTNGDIFILTSDKLNALVHIIEYGNGFVTFQLRGLEFRGTYCHQREVEAITESVAGDDSCCCAEPGHIPGFLSCNKTLGLRWLAWQVVSSCYTVHGYSIVENQAHLVFNTYDNRRNYITNYSKCIIYKLISSKRLSSLLENEALRETLQRQHEEGYMDLDPLFDESRNCDYSHTSRGVERRLFATCFQPFIQVCVEKQELEIDFSSDSFLVTLCFAYTLLGRRMFFQHAQQGASSRRGGDNFMHGLYKLFIGDARPNSENDEWVFNDVDSIKEIIIPAARTALKVHQDNFTFSEEYDSPAGVYDAVKDVEDNHVVTHENDHAWRTAVIMNKPSMLALRYQRTEDSYVYPYKLIRLSSKFIKFRVVKLNRECVRSLWTSQQHELIYLHNNDSERGSIQNHKPTLRNMVNSSMDLPIGYPIYVSPLQTSYIDRHNTYNNTFLSRVTNPLEIIKAAAVVKDLCVKCGSSCSKKMATSRARSGSKTEPGVVETAGGGPVARSGSVDSLTGMEYGTGTETPYENPFPDSDSDDDQFWKPIWVSKTVAITDTSEIFENFNISFLKWRDVSLGQKTLKSHWKAWRPEVGMEGEVVHEWRPFHIEAVYRSHIDKLILLVKMTDDLYVLVKEQGVKEI